MGQNPSTQFIDYAKYTENKNFEFKDGDTRYELQTYAAPQNRFKTSLTGNRKVKMLLKQLGEKKNGKEHIISTRHYEYTHLSGSNKLVIVERVEDVKDESRTIFEGTGKLPVESIKDYIFMDLNLIPADERFRRYNLQAHKQGNILLDQMAMES